MRTWSFSFQERPPSPYNLRIVKKDHVVTEWKGRFGEEGGLGPGELYKRILKPLKKGRVNGKGFSVLVRFGGTLLDM